jgi:hypothetical protein
MKKIKNIKNWLEYQVVKKKRRYFITRYIDHAMYVWLKLAKKVLFYHCLNFTHEIHDKIKTP